MEIAIQPLNGKIPKSQNFQAIVAPPYDVLTRDEAHQIAFHHPDNILHVTRAEIDLPAANHPYASHTYQQAKLNLHALLSKDVLSEISDSYLVYQIEKGTHVQTGLVAVCDSSDGFIKTHENTRPVKLKDRINLLQTLERDVSPVLLMHRHHDLLNQFLERSTCAPAYAEATLDDGAIHRVWLQASSNQLMHYLSQINALYMADGHHRLAANRACGNAVLAALFSEKQLNLLAYHRGVKLTSGLPHAEFLNKLSQHYLHQVVTKPELPKDNHEIYIYFENTWYHAREKESSSVDPLSCLPSVRLEEKLFVPCQVNSNTDLSFIGGEQAIDEIIKRVDNKDLMFGVLLAPVSIDDIMTLSDKKIKLPPKSTWFEPKVADGIVIV